MPRTATFIRSLVFVVTAASLLPARLSGSGFEMLVVP
jgi:hypothetical protein